MYFGFGDCGDMVMLRLVPHQQPTKNAEDHQHYFLTVTKKNVNRSISKKLLWIADRMTVIRNAERAL